MAVADIVAVHVQISMTTLLEFAVQNSDVQLILLSPQDIAAIEEAKQAVQADKVFPNPDIFLKIVQMRHQRHGADQSLHSKILTSLPNIVQYHDLA